MPLGVYVHIPFCFQKCNYCDFYSLGCSRSGPQEYIDALLRSIAQWKTEKSWRRPSTVYFGGGTPSLLSPAQLEQLLAALGPLPTAEITLEANPGTADAEKLRAFRAAGANRLSVGVQTASDASLKRLGRIHTAADSRAMLKNAAAAGFDNISGDVMLALPEYTPEELCATLELLCEGGVKHISSYLLKIEPGTPFGKRPPQNLPDEDAAADFYLACVEACAVRGFAQYEISNFAVPGYESRHNLCYWNCQDYLGIGPAAHSCLNGRRFCYPADTAAFLAGAQPVEDGVCTAEDFILLQLRLAKGLSLTELKVRWNVTFTSAQVAFLRQCEKNGLALLDDDRICLTPRGLLVQNSILCRLI